MQQFLRFHMKISKLLHFIAYSLLWLPFFCLCWNKLYILSILIKDLLILLKIIDLQSTIWDVWFGVLAVAVVQPTIPKRCSLDIDKFLVTKLNPPHKNIGIELPLGQILKSFVASESRTSLTNMAILTKIWNIGQK